VITKEDVLGYFADHNGTAAARPLARHFNLELRAAELHLERLAKYGLIVQRVHGFYVLTDKGRGRLAWYRGETSEGKIEFA